MPLLHQALEEVVPENTDAPIARLTPWVGQPLAQQKTLMMMIIFDRNPQATNFTFTVGGCVDSEEMKSRTKKLMGA
jgi:hypothetical protein